MTAQTPTRNDELEQRDPEMWASYPDVDDLASAIASQLCSPHHHRECMVNFYDGDDECNCEVREETGIAIVAHQQAVARAARLTEGSDHRDPRP